MTSGPMGYRGILGVWSGVGFGPLEVGKNLDRPVSERMEPNIYICGTEITLTIVLHDSQKSI